MDKGLTALQPLLIRPEPKNLLELKLVSCQTAPRIMKELAEFLISNKVKLRTLCLVRMQLKSSLIEPISSFLSQSIHLEDLDLSWNSLNPTDFIPLYNVLSENKTLRSLNLSFNTLIDKTEQNS